MADGERRDNQRPVAGQPRGLKLDPRLAETSVSPDCGAASQYRPGDDAALPRVQ